MEKQSLKDKYAKFQIKDILMSEEKIFIPTYQRAYSWEVKNSSNENKEVAILWEDIKSHIESKVKSNFYLGNFIFEEDNLNLGIIDGQQRLTTIILLLSALKNISNRSLDSYDLNNFSTVSYDEENFKKIISGKLLNIDNNSSDSIKKIFNAYNFFKEKLEEITSQNSENITLENIESLILESTCQINIIDDKIEAIQVFVFENNRGKTPTNLEIVKSMFMHFVYSTSEIADKDKIINDIETNFTSIYKNISILEGKIKEDFILGVAFRIHENVLKIQGNIVTEIEKKLEINFIKGFLKTLKDTFDFICSFIQQEKKSLEDEENYMVHSLLNLGIPGEIYPIIIKAMKMTSLEDKKLLISLYKALEAILIRGRITNAKVYHRLEGLYKENNSIKEKIENIIFRIDKMINSNEFAMIETEKEPNKNWWQSYWTREKFELNLNNGVKSLGATKYILWKYENQLRENNREVKIPFDKIKTYDVEHIAPKTENKENITTGYPIYDEEFYTKYLNSFGNLMLLEESINRRISNKSFKEKLKEYEKDKNKLIQQRQEILLEHNPEEILWTIDKIKNRETKIKEFIISKLSLKDFIKEEL